MTEAVPSYLSPTGQEIVFLLLSVVMVGSALLVVLTKQLVHAALWLVVCFGALAGGYLVLTAEFVAWVQVLIYVGAVVVLLLFGIMLTRAPIGRTADLDSGNRVIATLVSLATAAVLITVVVDGFRTAYTPLNPGHGAAGALGASVFRTWVLPFEALSVLLLAALIGAIVLSRTDIPSSPTTPPGQPRVGQTASPPGTSQSAVSATNQASSNAAPADLPPGNSRVSGGTAPANTPPGDSRVSGGTESVDLPPGNNPESGGAAAADTPARGEPGAGEGGERSTGQGGGI